jgi:RNA polymerase sigma-70 factor (sigma-E family)
MGTEAVRLTPVGGLPALHSAAPFSSVGKGVNERTERSDRDQMVSRLFDEHYRGLCRLAGLLLGDPAAAEEVVQEAFLRTFSGWWRVRHPERAQWYLRTSVVNLCRSRMRRRTTEDRGNRVTWSSSQGDVSEDGADRNVEALTLVALVRQLPPRQRDAVVLRYYEDLPEAEIARVLGCAVGTVKSQLSKARANLASALAEGSFEDSGTGLATEPEQGGSGA